MTPRVIARRVDIVEKHRPDELNHVPTGACPNAAANLFGRNDFRHAAQKYADRT